jgi:hypothetical protein
MGFILVFRRYAPFSKFGFGFEGDNRTGPSVSMEATARTIGLVPFERGSVGSIHAESSGTEFLGLGAWVRKLAGKRKSKVSCSISNKIMSKNSLSFTASTAGANPMVPGAPDIDTFVDFGVEWIGKGLRFRGSVRGDDFPNAEVFVLDSKGFGCLLFDGRTTGGQDTGPLTRLAGPHESQNLGSFSCAVTLSPGGIFLSSKLSCPSTTMEQTAGHRVAWDGSGGKFSGGGASLQW